MKNFLKKYDITPMKALKAAGVLLAVVILLTVFKNVFSNPVGPFSWTNSVGKSIATPGMQMAQYDYATEEGYAMGMGGGGDYGYYGMTNSDMMLSSRNVAGIMPAPSYPTTPGDGEAYEVTDYSASIETSNSERSCDQIQALKSRTDVVFERSNSYDRGCSFSFKVEHNSVDEILGLISTMHPEELSENTDTIKNQIDDFTSEILQNKLDSIDDTLSSALSAYDEITRLATRTENAEALAKIIDSRIGIIERLSQQRIEVVSQLERLARSKDEQLDRLTYTYFNVSVYETRYVDFENLWDSWKSELRSFVFGVNQTLQELTLGLVTLLLLIVQYAIYLAILLFVAKYAWHWGKKWWRM